MARRRWRPGLSLRILAVNIVAPLVLVLGVLYIGQYRDALIDAQLETLEAHAQVFAAAVSESAIRPVERSRPFMFMPPQEMEILVPSLGRRVVRRLAEATGSRARLFDAGGKLLDDSDEDASEDARRALANNTADTETTPSPRPPPLYKPMTNAMRMVVENLLGLIRNRPSPHALYPPPKQLRAIDDHPDAATALHGHLSATAWKSKDGALILAAAAPVRKARQTMGVVLLTHDDSDIEEAMIQVRFEVLMVFLVSLTLTILLSIYLAGIIGRPLRRLARAAEAIHQGKNRDTDIPDLSRRRDEIGDLSVALRNMTQALRDRMDTIEHFAADVAHEIKNPLTSLRSAVETVARVTNDDDRTQLMAIIQHDVQRLDRLISDISNASRLDAELSRDEMGVADLRGLLEQLATTYNLRVPESIKGAATVLVEAAADRAFTVRGNESRLAQVFENLITNALSFAPGSPVIVKLTADKKTIVVQVEDSGPGIPEAKREAIFERFYSERPKHEDFGGHSGLGLSIARQIVIAHNGKIFAENMYDTAGVVTGACFTVILDAAT